jgi:hypothetical protein
MCALRPLIDRGQDAPLLLSQHSLSLPRFYRGQLTVLGPQKQTAYGKVSACAELRDLRTAHGHFS